MAGYSGTPLAKKLGIVPGSIVLTEGTPPGYRVLLGPIPPAVRFVRHLTPQVRVIHLFATSAYALGQRLAALRATMAEDAALWVSWPKKSAKRETDITEDRIRAMALPLGLVDVKVCAVDETWSGLKLVIRRELRGKSQENSA